jgi:hypothetical protein
MRARPPKNQVPMRMTIMMLMALASVPPRYSQLLRLAIMAASMQKHLSEITKYQHQVLIATTSLLCQASCKWTNSRGQAVQGRLGNL